jgi:hypothetical protein
MKTLALLLLVPALCCAAPLPAQNIANMVAQSEAVMNAGLCQVANDTQDYQNETIAVLLPAPVGLRRILRNDYNWIRNTGYERNPKTGRYLMSERIEEACSADALSGRCLAVRSYWSQLPLSAKQPGKGVKAR